MRGLLSSAFFLSSSLSLVCVLPWFESGLSCVGWQARFVWERVVLSGYQGIQAADAPFKESTSSRCQEHIHIN
ncbi:hypothetical protein HDV57DRAFT_498551 [Trichoderma longibrachiatum]